MKLKVLAVLLLAALAIPLTAAQRLFPWPDSNAHWRVLVNVNEYIQSRPPTWFTNDKLITDLQIEKVTPQNYDQAVAQYDSIRQMLEGRGMYVGTYMSGTTVYPPDQLHTYPQAAVTTAQMPPEARYFGSWPNQPGRKSSTSLTPPPVTVSRSKSVRSGGLCPHRSDSSTTQLFIAAWEISNLGPATAITWAKFVRLPSHKVHA